MNDLSVFRRLYAHSIQDGLQASGVTAQLGVNTEPPAAARAAESDARSPASARVNTQGDS